MRINIVEDDQSRVPFIYPKEYQRLDNTKEESLNGNSKLKDRKVYIGNSTEMTKETVIILCNY